MNKKEPLVSICCITYNHEKYIRDAIEGFLMQKTTFPIEIIIHDDASTDGTAQIIKAYEDKYPGYFVTILQTDNQWCKGGGSIFVRFVFPRAHGKYIAMCEGDDYWTDPLKLQKQVDFLENHSEYGLCHTNFNLSSTRRISSHIVRRDDDNYLVDLLNGTYPIGTLTILFRRDLYESLPKLFDGKGFLMLDYPLIIEFARYSKIKYIPDITATYRQLENSASHSNNIEKELAFYTSSLNCRMFYANLYDISLEIPRKCYYHAAMKSAFIKKNKEFARKLWKEAKLNSHQNLSFKLFVFFLGAHSIFVRHTIYLFYNKLWEK